MDTDSNLFYNRAFDSDDFEDSSEYIEPPRRPPPTLRLPANVSRLYADYNKQQQNAVNSADFIAAKTALPSRQSSESSSAHRLQSAGVRTRDLAAAALPHIRSATRVPPSVVAQSSAEHGESSDDDFFS